MTNTQLGLLAMLLIAAGCEQGRRSGGKEAPSASAPSAAVMRVVGAPEATACPDRIKAWRQRLAQLQSEGVFTRPNDAISLARLSAKPTPPGDAITLSLTPDGSVFVDGVPRGLDLDLRDELKKRRELRQALPQPAGDPSVITLEFDAKTPWPKAGRLAYAARQAGFSSAAVRFAANSKLRPPVASKYTKLYEERARASAAVAVDPSNPPPTPVSSAELFASCPTAKTLLNALGKAAADRESHERRLWSELPSALSSCQCNVEWQALEAWVWELFGRFNGKPTTTVLLKPADSTDSSAAVVALPADATWSQGAEQLAAAAKGGGAIRMAVRPQ